MKGPVLLAIEEVQHRPGHTGKPLEVAYCGRVHVDAAYAAELGLQGAHTRLATVEASRAAAKTGEQVEVTYVDVVRERMEHRE